MKHAPDEIKESDAVLAECIKQKNCRRSFRRRAKRSICYRSSELYEERAPFTCQPFLRPCIARRGGRGCWMR